MNKRTFPTLADAKEAYPEYVLFDGENNQYYKPFGGSEPWDCACVAIWTASDGRVVVEEY